MHGNPQHLHYIRHKEERLLVATKLALSEALEGNKMCLLQGMFADFVLRFPSQTAGHKSRIPRSCSLPRLASHCEGKNCASRVQKRRGQAGMGRGLLSPTVVTLVVTTDRIHCCGLRGYLLGPRLSTNPPCGSWLPSWSGTLLFPVAVTYLHIFPISEFQPNRLLLAYPEVCEAHSSRSRPSQPQA